MAKKMRQSPQYDKFNTISIHQQSTHLKNVKYDFILGFLLHIYFIPPTLVVVFIYFMFLSIQMQNESFSSIWKLESSKFYANIFHDKRSQNQPPKWSTQTTFNCYFFDAKDIWYLEVSKLLLYIKIYDDDEGSAFNTT